MEQNYQEAIRWLNKAAEKGNPEAQYKLAKILSEEVLKQLEASMKQEYKEAIDFYPELLKSVKDLKKSIPKPKEIPVKPEFGNLKEGATIKFGSYPQTADGAVQPIEWLVLEVKNGKALLLSKYGLDAKPFNIKCETITLEKCSLRKWLNEDFITWEKCSLRKWLNEDFYNKAFTSEQQMQIAETKVKAEKNPEYSTNQGNDTVDRVFLLNIQEAYKYFQTSEARKTPPTEYAVRQGAYRSDSGQCWWWLRSSGCNSCSAATVRTDGDVRENGNNVNNDHNAVRPALWLNLKS